MPDDIALELFLCAALVAALVVLVLVVGAAVG